MTEGQARNDDVTVGFAGLLAFVVRRVETTRASRAEVTALIASGKDETAGLSIQEHRPFLVVRHDDLKDNLTDVRQRVIALPGENGYGDGKWDLKMWDLRGLDLRIGPEQGQVAVDLGGSPPFSHVPADDQNVLTRVRPALLNDTPPEACVAARIRLTDGVLQPRRIEDSGTWRYCTPNGACLNEPGTVEIAGWAQLTLPGPVSLHVRRFGSPADPGRPVHVPGGARLYVVNLPVDPPASGGDALHHFAAFHSLTSEGHGLPVAERPVPHRVLGPRAVKPVFCPPPVVYG